MKFFLYKKYFFLLSIVFLILAFASCDNARLFEQNLQIPETGWKISDVKKFEVDIKDPSIATNFYINVRNADGYPYSNLYLFVKTIFPNGKQSNDTLECILADEKGKWLGSGMGDIYDNQIPFKRNVHFPEPGKYTFELQHGMRLETLPLIMDIGLRIEKVK